MKKRSVLSLLLASLLTLSLTSCQDSGESSTAETSPANNSSSSEEAASSESEEEPYLIHMVSDGCSRRHRFGRRAAGGQ